MKKMLLLSATLMLLSICTLTFTFTSCSKLSASPNNTNTYNNKMLLYVESSTGGNIYIMNNDGTGYTIIPLTLPANEIIANTNITTDGSHIFFGAAVSGSNTHKLYKQLLTGGTPTLLKTFTGEVPNIRGLY